MEPSTSATKRRSQPVRNNERMSPVAGGGVLYPCEEIKTLVSVRVEPMVAHTPRPFGNRKTAVHENQPARWSFADRPVIS